MFRLRTGLDAQRKKYLREVDPWGVFLIVFSMGALDPLMGEKEKQIAAPSQ